MAAAPTFTPARFWAIVVLACLALLGGSASPAYAAAEVASYVVDSAIAHRQGGHAPFEAVYQGAYAG